MSKGYERWHYFVGRTAQPDRPTIAGDCAAGSLLLIGGVGEPLTAPNTGGTPWLSRSRWQGPPLPVRSVDAQAGGPCGQSDEAIVTIAGALLLEVLLVGFPVDGARRLLLRSGVAHDAERTVLVAV
jgi:hypothetical protein